MKSSIVVILLLSLQIHCGYLAKVERTENQKEADQQQRARVHRVADYEFPEKIDSQMNTIKDIMMKQAIILGSQELGKLLADFPNLHSLIEHETQLFMELSMILMELVQDGTFTLKNIDLAISEMMGTGASSTSVKTVSKNDNGLRKLLNSLEEMNVYQRNGEVDKNQENSTSQAEATSEMRMTTVKNVAQTLDNVLVEIQNHLNFVRNVFERMCRKHHSTSPTQSSPTNPGKFPSMNQPNKVSIL